MKKGTIFSGMRPSGRLHLGNFEVLRNWVRLQDSYELFCGIVDLHALTTDHEDTRALTGHCLDMAMDFIAAGIDPERSHLLIQSHVPQHAQLHLLFSMITPLSWLERVPTYKEKVDNLSEPPSYGLLGYPVLMAADIVLYKANAVPVAQDQLPHLELTREIIRRFHHLYQTQIFPEPQAVLLEGMEVLPGLDGRKMSKSYGNTILPAEDPESIRQKVKTMFTDPLRIYRKDPGHPDTCPVFAYQALYNREQKEQIRADCQGAVLGCVQCKQVAAEALIAGLEPIRERRKALEASPGKIKEILAAGEEHARRVAGDTLAEVMAAMRLP